MAIVEDDFESYSLGRTTPLTEVPYGWDSDATDQAGIIVANDPFNPSGKCLLLNGRIRSKPLDIPVNVITAIHNLWVPLNNNSTADAGILSYFNVVVATKLGPKLLVIGLTEDNRISVKALSSEIGISNTEIHPDTWYKIRTDVSFSEYDSDPPHGIEKVSVQVKLYIEDNLEFDNTVLTSQLVAALPVGLGANMFVFGAATNGGSLIDNVFIDDSTPALIPSSLPGRIAHEVIELPNRPPVYQAWIAHEVIELVVRDKFPAAGWKVYEA